MKKLYKAFIYSLIAITLIANCCACTDSQPVEVNNYYITNSDNNVESVVSEMSMQETSSIANSVVSETESKTSNFVQPTDPNLIVGINYTVTGTTNYLALRNAPAYDGNNEIAKMKNGDELTVQSQNVYGDNGEYCYVTALTGTAKGQSGYVNKSYITPSAKKTTSSAQSSSSKKTESKAVSSSNYSSSSMTDNLLFSGVVYSDVDKLPLSGVKINGYKSDSNEPINLGTTTTDGAYSITLVSDIKKIEFSLSGFKTKTINDFLSFDGNVYLEKEYTSIFETIPDGALTYNGHSYFIYTGICSTWNEAKEYCESQGGYLAVINTSEENQALFEYMTKSGYKSAYFGYYRTEDKSVWNWVDNKGSDYTNWSYNEPNNEAGSENFAMFYYKYTDGKWNDGDFNGRTANDVSTFICEWDK